MKYLKNIVLNITFLLLFIFLTVLVLTKQTLYFDKTISIFVYSLRTPLLTNVMSAVSNLGDVYAGIVVSLLIILMLIIKEHKKDAVIFSLSTITVGLINYVLKLVFAIPRPNFSALTTLYDFSYPSGHAMNNTFLYGMIVYYISRYGKNKLIKLLALAGSIVWITLMGISRIYLGVHYPTDVLAGYFLGLWALITVTLVSSKSVKRD